VGKRCKRQETNEHVNPRLGFLNAGASQTLNVSLISCRGGSDVLSAQKWPRWLALLCLTSTKSVWGGREVMIQFSSTSGDGGGGGGDGDGGSGGSKRLLGGD
jgi:hypothetical protein